MNDDLKKSIKAQGYWRVIIRPIGHYNTERFTRQELNKIVTESQVRLRGWYYPHIQDSTILVGTSIIASSCQYAEHREYWEYHGSGQFSHIFAIREDYYVDDTMAQTIKSGISFHRNKADEINKFMDIVSIVYEITEIYLFASRIAQYSGYSDISEFEIAIELHDTEGRMLFVRDFLRFLIEPYICAMPEIMLKKTYQKDELIANFDSLAFEKIVDAMKQFNWDEPNRQALLEDQKKFLERRF